MDQTDVQWEFVKREYYCEFYLIFNKKGLKTSVEKQNVTFFVKVLYGPRR